jgi:hypothetical protein
VLLITAMLPAKSEASTKAFVTLRAIVLLIVMIWLSLFVRFGSRHAPNISHSYIDV